jgi:hypothetical protein
MTQHFDYDGLRVDTVLQAAKLVASAAVTTAKSGGQPVLPNNEERVVATGVRVSAIAAVVNLTISETEQAGFAVAVPANSPWPGSSSINWSSSGHNLANSVITAMDPTGQVRIRAA